MRRSLLLPCFGKELYGKTSTLPNDFYGCCKNHFGIKLHHPTFIGVRSSQVRGLFLSRDGGPIPANTAIATIPLSTLYTTANITTKANTMRNVTLEDVTQAIRDEEFRTMAPHFFLGLQTASIISCLPDILSAGTSEEIEAMSVILREGANPWARMLDDEDFNEQFVFGMYGMALDSWQRHSFDEMTKKFHQSVTNIHEKVQPPFSLDQFRRITRLVVARAEVLPPPDYYHGGIWKRRAQRLLRKLRKLPDPALVTLVPFLEMVNHSNRPNCGIRVGPSSELPGGEAAITLYSIARIEPGQELCRHYNLAINRAAALFRYGFLPFDLISIVEHDAIDEYLVKNQDMIRPQSDEVMLERKKEMDEIHRLERIYKSARMNKAVRDQ